MATPSQTTAASTQDVELADTRPPAPAYTAPNDSSATILGHNGNNNSNANFEDDRSASVYRPSSMEDADAPPAYINKPPPYRFKEPEPPKPRPRWVQWVDRHRKKLMVGFLLFVPVIVCATIYGIMKARAQGIVNAMQFEGGNWTSLSLYTASTGGQFHFRDRIWNNDSQYPRFQLDSSDSMKITLQGADEPFSVTPDNGRDLFDGGANDYDIDSSLGTSDQVVEFFKQVINEDEVSAWVEGKMKMKLPGLPKYSVDFKKKMKLPGAGGITAFNITFPRFWNDSDPALIEQDKARPRSLNFQANGGLQARSNSSGAGGGPSIGSGYFNDMVMLAVDIYQNGTDTRLGRGNLTNFAIPYQKGASTLSAVIDVDYGAIAQLARAYDGGMMPWALRPTGAFVPYQFSEWYDNVEAAEEMPWFAEVVRGMEIPMMVNVTQGMQYINCGYSLHC